VGEWGGGGWGDVGWWGGGGGTLGLGWGWGPWGGGGMGVGTPPRDRHPVGATKGRLGNQVAERMWPEKMNWVGGMRVAYRDFYRIVDALRASPLGKRAFGSCWAKGPAVFGIRSLGGMGPLRHWD
jgi:hypothetical protein